MENNHSITLWQGEIAGIADGAMDCGRYWQLLSQREQQHANNFKSDALRWHYVETHARLRMLLGQLVNQAPAQLRILKAEHGKPYLADYPDLAFNLSHTENLLLVATAYGGHQLGVDIESCKPRDNFSALVARCFAEEEKAYWHQLPEARQTEAFYQFWTRKEAFVKAAGRGLALGLNQIAFNPENLNELLRIPTDYGQTKEWFIKEIAIGKNMCGALAAKTKAANPAKIELVLNALPTLNRLQKNSN